MISKYNLIYLEGAEDTINGIGEMLNEMLVEIKVTGDELHDQ